MGDLTEITIDHAGLQRNSFSWMSARKSCVNLAPSAYTYGPQRDKTDAVIGTQRSRQESACEHFNSS